MAKNMSQSKASSEPLTTADGVSLKVSLNRALRRRKITALLLVTPLFLFIMLTFLGPIFDMLLRSVDNKIIAQVLPKTVPQLAGWDASSGELPDEAVFKAFVEDAKIAAENKTITRVGKRLNYEKPGMSSLFRKTGRNLKKFDPDKLDSSYTDLLLGMDKKWANTETWWLMQRESGKYTSSYYYSAVDAEIGVDGVQLKPEDQRIYMKLLKRTMWLSSLITLLTVVLGYPIAYLLANLKTKTSNLLMILVLLPFWTSLLVRTSAWIALLQREGVVNDFLVALGFIGDDGRLAMIHKGQQDVSHRYNRANLIMYHCQPAIIANKPQRYQKIVDHAFAL